MLPPKAAHHEYALNDVPASAPHNITSHPKTHSRNPSVEHIKAGEDRPRSYVAQSPNARIRYSLPPAEPAVRSRQTPVPIYVEGRRGESPRTSDESKRSGGTSSAANARNFSRPGNFSRPLPLHRTSKELSAIPASPPLPAVESHWPAQKAAPQTPTRTKETTTPYIPAGGTSTRSSISYQDREPSREVRRPTMSPRAQSNITEAATTYAMSTAFWETAAKSTESQTQTNNAAAEVERVPFNCRLDSPFDPGWAYY